MNEVYLFLGKFAFETIFWTVIFFSVQVAWDLIARWWSNRRNRRK